MNRYLEIARQVVPDGDSATSDRRQLPSHESPELMRVLRLILEVFPGSQVVAVDETEETERGSFDGKQQ